MVFDHYTIGQTILQEIGFCREEIAEAVPRCCPSYSQKAACFIISGVRLLQLILAFAAFYCYNIQKEKQNTAFT